jgi:diguanylate cyclase (GGDEF)-like protein
MIWAVLIVGTLNLGVGFALAVYIHSGAVPGWGDLAVDMPGQAKSRFASADSSTRWLDQAPSEWAELAPQIGKCPTLAEAIAHVLRWLICEYRDQLIAVDVRLREAMNESDSQALGEVRSALLKRAALWRLRLSDMAQRIAGSQPSAEKSPLGDRLQQLLDEQIEQLSAADEEINGLDLDADPMFASDELLGSMIGLFRQVHVFRDALIEAATSAAIEDGRIEKMDRRLQVDGMTGLCNQTGLRARVHEWRRDHPSSERPLSLIALDVDHFTDLNARYGPRAADRIAAAIARLLNETLPADDGVLVSAHGPGQRFTVFCGDVSSRKAAEHADRIRQAIAAATFQLDEDEFDVAVSCGVICVTDALDEQAAFARLSSALKRAKQAGGNCTTIDPGDGPEPVESRDLKLPSQIVLVA